MSKAVKKPTGDVLQSNEEKEMYACKVWGLQTKLALEKEKADNTKMNQLELKQKVLILTEDLKKEKEKLFSISTYLSNENKEMQEKMKKEINDSNAYINELKEKIESKDEQIKEMIKSHETILFKRDEEIRELKRKIDEMNIEFSKIMKDILERMNEKIEITQWEDIEKTYS